MTKKLSAYEIMERLVAFATVSRASNLDLIDWVEEYLNGFGVSATRVYNDEGNKANLYANIGPEVEGGVILSGHTDVVPVDGQNWDTDPFEVVEKGGRYYGRGTCDMKGFGALALAAVPLALKRGVKRPLQIALSYDEEVGCVGAPRMIAQMADLLPRASGVIIGEPSLMKVVTGHKGGYAMATHLRGYEVHSSAAHIGVSAVMEAAKLVDWANQQNAKSMAATPSPVAAMFVPPWTSAHVGTIRGGTAENITAKDCSFVMGFRVVPGDDPEEWKARYLEKVAEVEAAMKAVQPSSKITVKPSFGVPGLVPEEDGVAEALARRLTGDNATHVVSYGTEAGQFQQGGYSAVICGPGSIDQAHQANEYIEKSQFEAGWNFMEKLVDHLVK
ncbi:MAG: acetylornithine deacetylase [Rhodobacteraceae bacterium]|nr:acetylornithine deacetylase [Paracoccaceae bacterium]